MKRLLTIACLLVTMLASARSAEAPQDQQLIFAINEVRTQQATISQNQVKIEEKLAAVAEAIRVARIYSSRSGN